MRELNKKDLKDMWPGVPDGQELGAAEQVNRGVFNNFRTVV